MTRRSSLLAVLLVCAAVGSMAAAIPGFWEQRITQWRALPPGERAALAERLHAWDASPVSQKQEYRERYRAWRELEEAQRMRLRATAGAFAALPASEQIRLRQVFVMQDAAQQRGWRLGPELGASWPRLQPLFAYVPPAQRIPLLQILRQLDAQQRDDLAALAQRIPPQSRDAFRRELLRVPPAQRAQWLHQRRSQ